MGVDREAVRVAVLCLLQFIDVMGATMVITLLPVMLAEVDVGPSGATFLSTAYAVAFGGCLVLGARLGDVFGHVRMIVASTVVFAVAGAVVAFAPTLAVLTAGRLVQGLAAAVTVPAAIFMITTTTAEGPRRQRAIAAWSAAGAAAGATGFVVGGVASALDQWRASFLVLGVLAAVLGLLTRWLFHHVRSRREKASLDLAGGAALTLAVALTVTATALSEQQLGLALVLGAGAVVAGICLVGIERASKAPILPAAVLRSSHVQRGSGISFVNTATTSSAATMVTLSLQEEQGYSGIATAAVLLPFNLAVISGASLAPRVMRRAGDGVTMACGLAGIGIGIAVLPVAHEQLIGVGFAMTLSGAGIGLSSSAATHTGTSVAEEARAAAGALVNTAAQLGTALGIAVSLSVAVRWGYPTAWVVLALFALAGAVIASRWKALASVE